MPQRYHKEDIKAAVRKKGSTLQALSIQHGLQEKTVAGSLRVPMPRANRAIADFLGISLHQLWPAWYDQSGNRIPSGNSRKRTPKRQTGHCQKSEQI